MPEKFTLRDVTDLLRVKYQEHTGTPLLHPEKSTNPFVLNAYFSTALQQAARDAGVQPIRARGPHPVEYSREQVDQILDSFILIIESESGKGPNLRKTGLSRDIIEAIKLRLRD